MKLYIKNILKTINSYFSLRSPHTCTDTDEAQGVLVWNSLLIISVKAVNKSGCWPPAVVATADKDRFNSWFLASQPSVHLFYCVHELREGATPGCELTDPNMFGTNENGCTFIRLLQFLSLNTVSLEISSNTKGSVQHIAHCCWSELQAENFKSTKHVQTFQCVWISKDLDRSGVLDLQSGRNLNPLFHCEVHLMLI